MKQIVLGIGIGFLLIAIWFVTKQTAPMGSASALIALCFLELGRSMEDK